MTPRKAFQLLIIFAVAAVAYFFWHVPVFSSVPDPAKTYVEATQRFAALEKNELPESAGIPHDMVDPNQPGANPKLVYSKLLKLLGVEK